jgi:hypothetical protein
MAEFMEEKKKKAYEKPKLTRIVLDAKCAVLGFCKGAGGVAGPALPGCQDAFGSPCSDSGS